MFDILLIFAHDLIKILECEIYFACYLLDFKSQIIVKKVKICPFLCKISLFDVLGKNQLIDHFELFLIAVSNP